MTRKERSMFTLTIIMVMLWVGFGDNIIFAVLPSLPKNQVLVFHAIVIFAIAIGLIRKLKR